MAIDRRALLGAGTLAAVGASSAAAQPVKARDRLLGAWSLVEAVTFEDGKPTGLWNDGPIARLGLIMYQPDGWMSVQIARPRRPIDHSLDFAKLPSAERLGYLDSYYGYFGRFEIDEAASEVHHNIVSALNPAEIGVKYRRRFRFEAEKLVLTTLDNAGPVKTGYNQLTWVRA